MSLEFRIAKSEEELEKVYRLRYESYVQENYFKPTDFPDMQEKDRFDSVAINFYAYNKSICKMVGAIRLIPYTRLGLPLEEIYDISSFTSNGKRIAEVSRRITLEGHVKANFGLVQTVFQYSSKHQISDFLFIVNPKDIPQYEKLGARMFDDIRFYEKVSNWAVPFHLDISKCKPPYDSLIYGQNPAIIID
jgi:hypothetical protein